MARDRAALAQGMDAAFDAIRAAFHRRHFDQRRGGMRKPKGLEHVRRNRNEHIAVGIRSLLVHTDPYEFETTWPAVHEQAATVPDPQRAIHLVVERCVQKLRHGLQVGPSRELLTMGALEMDDNRARGNMSRENRVIPRGSELTRIHAPGSAPLRSLNFKRCVGSEYGGNQRSEC